ncbi:recombination-related endonuclease [Erwinia phage FBB1]|nr:recombination-related endonuclease [Erwinia phage FBB1]
MKTFKLKRVKYKNIMSVGQASIDIQLDKVNKTLVTGKNGGGKSTILEAITFALFGKPFRDIKKGQLVNSYNKKDMLVELWMEYNGNEYYIKRGQKPNVFEIERDGTKLNEAASTRDFQEYFESLIGMSYGSFKQVAVLGTAGYVPFMGLAAGARRKLVEDLLEVSVLADMDKLNKSQIREINSQTQVIDAKKDGIVQQIKIYEENTEKQKKLSGDNVSRLQVMYEDLIKEARGYKEVIQKLNDELLSFVLEEDQSDSWKSLQADLIGKRNDLSQITKVISLYERGGSCPTCFQQLEKHGNVMNQVKNKQDELKEQIEKSSLHLEQVNTMVEEFRATQASMQRVKSEILNNKQAGAAIVEKAKKVKALIDKAQSEVIDYSDKIKELQEELDKLVKLKTDLVMEKYHRGIIVDMLKDSGIKSGIIKEYIPMFNEKINSYLKIMEADYSFNLDEEFNETIKSRGREEFSYASFSQGEKARIDIAILFTWKSIAERVSGVKISTLILDEVFDSATDYEGVKAIATILNSMTDTNTFIISHRDHDPQDYGQHIKMKKVGRFTVMDAS